MKVLRTNLRCKKCNAFFAEVEVNKSIKDSEFICTSCRSESDTFKLKQIKRSKQQE